MTYGENGSVIGPQNLPTSSAASGIWSMGEIAEAQRDGIWPTHVKGTMELIGEFVAGGYPGVSGDIEFTSIPQTYRTLRVVMANGKRAAAANTLGMTFNGDSTTGNYSNSQFYNTGSNTTFDTGSAIASFTPANDGPAASGSAFWMADIMNYSDASVGTAAQIHYGCAQDNSSGATGIIALGYNQNSAVTSLELKSPAGANYYFFEPTVVALFGIGIV